MLNYNKATRPWLLLPVGLAYAAAYYAVFRFTIVRFDLKTPGREPADQVATPVTTAGGRAPAFVGALGGATNLRAVNACTTRLRLVMVDTTRVDEPALRALGAKGIVRPAPGDLQVVLGPTADMVASEIRDWMKANPQAEKPVAPSPAATATQPAEPSPAQSAAAVLDPVAIAQALGGDANIRSLSGRSTRLLVTLADASLIDESGLRAAGVRAVAQPGENVLHLLVGNGAETLARRMRAA